MSQLPPASGHARPPGRLQATLRANLGRRPAWCKLRAGFGVAGTGTFFHAISGKKYLSSFASASWVPQQTHNVSLLETPHASRSGRDEPNYLEPRTFWCDTERIV